MEAEEIVIGSLFPLGGAHASAEIRKNSALVAAQMITQDDSFNFTLALDTRPDSIYFDDSFETFLILM